MTTELEEVVMGSDGLDVQDVHPDLRERALGVRSRSDAVRAAGLLNWSWQCLSVELSARGEFEVINDHDRSGHHVDRQ
jgi:hypothetical protein